MTAEEQPPLLCTPEILREQRIDSRPDTAAKRLASRQHELVVMDGSTVRYDRLLLATGTTARSWTVPGGRHTHVMRDVADAKRLRATLNSGSCVVLIGTGFIAWNWRRARWPEAAA